MVITQCDVGTRVRLSLTRGLIWAIAVSLGAVLSATAVSGTPVHATCAPEGLQTLHAPGSRTGYEYNKNGVTCNGDTQYTGRFCDLKTDGYRIKVVWANAPGSGSAISDGLSCEWLWQFDDTNQSSDAWVCLANLSGGTLACNGPAFNSTY